MASRAAISTALLLLFNILFFIMVSSTYIPCPPTQKTPNGGHDHGHKPSNGKCPKDTIRLGVCANLLNDLVHLVVGTLPKTPWVVKAAVLGINLNVPVSLSLILNYCGKKVPSGFQCA